MSDADRRAKVVRWAQRHLGKKVGKGQCWDLAHQALLAAGAFAGTSGGEEVNYVWGTEIDPPTAAEPGDILQFRNYVMTRTVTTTVTFAAETPTETTQSHFLFRPHHTAIVVAKEAGLGKKVLEQNVDPKGMVVQANTLWVATRGPLDSTPELRTMKDASGKMRQATVVVTTTVTVTGQVWAYRPKAKK